MKKLTQKFTSTVDGGYVVYINEERLGLVRKVDRDWHAVDTFLVGFRNPFRTRNEIFDALKLTFDLDPCSPGAGHWVPARKVYTKADDGLAQPWSGLVFMNPPFGGRNGHVPWLRRFFDHVNGIAIARAYTSSAWFHAEVVPRAETLLFPKGKTKFIRPATVKEFGETGDPWVVGTAPGHGIVLIGMGAVANAALIKSGLGLCCDLRGREAA